MLISLITKSFALLVAIIRSLKLSKTASSVPAFDLGLLVRVDDMLVAMALGTWPIEAIDDNRLLNALCTGWGDGAVVVDCTEREASSLDSMYMVFMTSTAAL